MCVLLLMMECNLVLDLQCGNLIKLIHLGYATYKLKTKRMNILFVYLTYYYLIGTGTNQGVNICDNVGPTSCQLIF